MTSSELAEHARYVGDPIKMNAYRRALRDAVRSGGASVLDLGSGTGILGLLAVDEGADVVYAVDRGSIQGPAADAGNAAQRARIVRLEADSTEVELPDRADVAVCDQIGGFVHDAGVLEFFADARHRLLADGARLIPAAFRLHVAPAACGSIRSQIDLWGSHPEGFDLDVFAELAINTEHRIDAADCEVVAPSVVVADITSDDDGRFQGSGEVIVERETSFDGLVGWFVADLGGGVSLTNDPRSPDRMNRWCNFYPIDRTLSLAAGSRISVDVDVRPLLHAVTWRVVVKDPSGTELTSERHSTLLGEFMSSMDLRVAGGAPIRPTKMGRLLLRALELSDGSRTPDDVIGLLRTEVGGDNFSDNVESAVRSWLRKLTEPV